MQLALFDEPQMVLALFDEPQIVLALFDEPQIVKNKDTVPAIFWADFLIDL